MSKQKPLLNKGKHQSKEFKQSAVQMVLEDHLEVSDVASRLGIPKEALKRWLKAEEKRISSKDQASLKELLLANKKQEEEIRRLKMEREILKKAMAYFMPGQS
jgi:transposase